MPFSLRRFLRRLRAMTLSAEDAAAVSEGDRRPWEPPFDASKPAPPISHPITELAALASRSYLSDASNFHLPFNRASTPLPSPGAPLPARRRVLVCHDLQGRYRDDAAPQGGANPDAYALWHWHLIDVFVYFSHYLVTLPPPCWTNAAHLHGVKVLGTFITEWDKGAEICREMFATEDSAQMYAERLAELAATLGFDGWLINIEVKLDIQFIDNLKEFVNHLTKRMHAAVPGSLVIWYDAVTVNGHLDWHDKLNKQTIHEILPQLLATGSMMCTWVLMFSVKILSVVGNGIQMLPLIYLRKMMSRLPYLLLDGYMKLSNHLIFRARKIVGGASLNDHGVFFRAIRNGYLSIQILIRVMVIRYLLKVYKSPVIHGTIFLAKVFSFKDEQYTGGDCVTVKGSLKQNAIFSEQLFNGGLFMEDGSVHLFYSVKADANCGVGLSLDLSSRNKGNTSILVAEDIATFHRKKQNRMYSSYVQSDKVAPQAPDNQNWVLYQATVQSSASYTLTGINIVCTSKTTGKINLETEEGGSSEADANRSSPYHASLGHISIRNSENTQFPPVESWVTEGEYISWSNNSNTSKLVSLKISWKLNTRHQASFMKYNVYVEILTADSNAKAPRNFLGVASVEAFYVSDFQVPNEVTTLKFIIQACGCDGSRQEFEECPKYFLVPVDYDV